jgi:hypothetical protein
MLEERMENQNGKAQLPILRKRFLIYPRFQLSLLGMNVVVTATIFAFVILQARKSYSHLKQLGLDVGLPAGDLYFRFLDLQAGTLFSNIAIAMALGLLVSLGAMLYLSHRVAGPITRLHGHFDQILEHPQLESDLKFRKGDFFSELPQKINAAMKAIRKEQRS